jgi:hypothetical protein
VRDAAPWRTSDLRPLTSGILARPDLRQNWLAGARLLFDEQSFPVCSCIKRSRRWAGVKSIWLSSQRDIPSKPTSKTLLARWRRSLATRRRFAGGVTSIRPFSKLISMETQIEGLKEKTEEAISENIYDLRSNEIAILKFLQARLTKKAA